MPTKSKYQEWVDDKVLKDKLLLIEAWARDGLIDVDIAKNLGIHESTLYEYKKKYPKFKKAFKKGKEISDVIVENALYKRATGYTYDEETQEMVDGKMQVTKIVTKHVYPDMKAIDRWQFNRRPDKWKLNPLENIDTVVVRNENVLSTEDLVKLANSFGNTEKPKE